jgi:hypothetical protein
MEAIKEFLQTPAGLAAAGFAAIFGLVGLVVVLNKVYRYLKYNIQGYPLENEVEAALLPYLYGAMMTAYRASERLMDSVSERLHGVDKSKLARRMYYLLPNSVSIAGVSWNWKKFVSEGQFSNWMQKRFEKFIEWWDLAERGILLEMKPEGDPAMVTPLPGYRIAVPPDEG